MRSVHARACEIGVPLHRHPDTRRRLRARWGEPVPTLVDDDLPIGHLFAPVDGYLTFEVYLDPDGRPVAAWAPPAALDDPIPLPICDDPPTPPLPPAATGGAERGRRYAGAAAAAVLAGAIIVNTWRRRYSPITFGGWPR